MIKKPTLCLCEYESRPTNEIMEQRRAAMQFYREQYELKHGPIPPVVYDSDDSDKYDIVR